MLKRLIAAARTAISFSMRLLGQVPRLGPGCPPSGGEGSVPWGSRWWRALAGSCLAFSITTLHLLADDWPHWLGPQRDSVWREKGIVETFPAEGPQVRWRTAIGGGFAGPAVTEGRVYVTDHQLAPGATNPKDPFAKGMIPGKERVLCLDEKSGKQLWSYEYDCPYTMSYPSGPRTTPSVERGRVYCLGAEGNLFCLDAASGKPIWAHNLNSEYGAKTPLWGYAAHPLVEGDQVFSLVGGEGSAVVAFDRQSGKELWRALSAKEIGYSPPILIEHNARRQLIVWHPESVNALDPVTGKVEWTVPFSSRMGLSVATARKADDFLFFTAFYDGSLALRLSADQPQVVWKSKKASEKDTDGLHSIIPTPFLEDGYIYGVCSYGQLRCLRADTGERIWETFKATTTDGKELRWGNAFLVKNGSRFLLFNEQGDLIIARLSPKGYEEISRVHCLEPTNPDPGRAVVWSHPAFANRSMYARNDREIVCISLAKGK